MTTIISVENLSKTYHLGQIGTGTFTNDLKVWWAKVRGKPNPMLKIGETDHGNRDGEEVWALKDVSFQVEQGEVLGIIGRNGAGKSTLLKILSRVTAPTSGSIKIKGRVASLLEVGTGFHPELTGRENIYLNGSILGMSRREIDRKFDEIVDFAEVEKFIDTPVKRYSSGMYVRLAFAVAAHLEPEILVVDEVLAVGDAAFQKKCLGKMSDVAHEGRTVLFVSHNMESIRSLCSRSILLHSGCLTENGVTDNVIRQYIYQSASNITGFVDLNSRQNASLPVRISYVKIMNREGLITSSIICGEALQIEVETLCLKDGDRIFFDFLIRDELGARLGLLSSYFAHSNEIIAKDKMKARVEIENLNLAPSRYFIDLMIHRYGGEKILDLQDAVAVDIMPSDLYGTGKLQTRSLSLVCFLHKWSFEA